MGLGRKRLELPPEAVVDAAHQRLRAAAHRAAALLDRRTVHRALAEATDPETDPDPRAWHRPNAAMGPGEEVA